MIFFDIQKTLIVKLSHILLFLSICVSLSTQHCGSLSTFNPNYSPLFCLSYSFGYRCVWAEMCV